ncbi:MAG: recombinase [Sneathiella sp.]|nr:MAG: recombinase [Sneathiella sp.]
MRHAVIYCRVSSKKQAKMDGLASQETRSREFAKFKGYSVVEVFTDDLTGRVVSRPGMNAMLAYLRKHRKDRCIAIVDDISRLARNVEAHWELRRTIAAAGGELQSPSIEFGEGADNRFVENVLAGSAQHQAEKNAEQTVNRMRARVMNGYWPFSKPVGYKHKATKDRGKILVRNEPVATIIQEALEGYASGRFETQAEVMRFLQSFPEFPKDRSNTVRNQRIKFILTRSIYAGYVESSKWNVSRRPGNHEALISYETFTKIQDRLAGNARAPARKDLNADFPLRGAVQCGDCQTPLTACWSKGSHAHYPYYLCPKKGCYSYGKSIQRSKIEGEFEVLLKKLTPTEGLFKLACVMFEDIWNHRLATQKTRSQNLSRDAIKVDRDIEKLLDQLVEADSSTVIKAYERRINKLEEKKIEFEEKAAACALPARSFEATLRTALDFLSNPHKLWASERLQDKRTVLRLAFADRLTYVRNEGFRTANLALPFKALADFNGSKEKMAHRGRFELPTPRFVV